MKRHIAPGLPGVTVTPRVVTHGERGFLGPQGKLLDPGQARGYMKN